MITLIDVPLKQELWTDNEIPFILKITLKTWKNVFIAKVNSDTTPKQKGGKV